MDISLTLEPNSFYADIALDGSQLETDSDLQTAVIISLFTDRRANNDDIVETNSRRGWWGDTYAEINKDKIGSRLWLLSREKQTQQTLNRAYEYVKEALSWMLDDNVAQNVDIDVQYIRTGILGIAVEIKKPVGTKTFRYEYAWRQLNAV